MKRRDFLIGSGTALAAGVVAVTGTSESAASEGIVANTAAQPSQEPDTKSFIIKSGVYRIAEDGTYIRLPLSTLV